MLVLVPDVPNPKASPKDERSIPLELEKARDKAFKALLKDSLLHDVLSVLTLLENAVD